MSLLALQLLIHILITQLSNKWSWVFERHTVECSESHNWDLMVRGSSLIDPCWSELKRAVNRWLLTMQHSHARKNCKWRWQQPLSAGAVGGWLGGAGNTLFFKPPTRPRHQQTMRGDCLCPARLFEIEDSSREWCVCASTKTLGSGRRGWGLSRQTQCPEVAAFQRTFVQAEWSSRSRQTMMVVLTSCKVLNSAWIFTVHVTVQVRWCLMFLSGTGPTTRQPSSKLSSHPIKQTNEQSVCEKTSAGVTLHLGLSKLCFFMLFNNLVSFWSLFWSPGGITHFEKKHFLPACLKTILCFPLTTSCWQNTV